MTTRRKRPIDILSVGELLIDLISTEFTDELQHAALYRRMQGGSPANLCMNMARLGNRTQMAATVGADAMGNYLIEQLKGLDVDCELIRQVWQPTTLILVTRSREVSSFQPYRAADCQIDSSQIPLPAIADYSIFHTTCFALSAPPAQEAILDGAVHFARSGGQLSIDLNYAPEIWPDRDQAQRLVATYCSYGAVVKISDVDWSRLWPDRNWSPKEICRYFLGLGAREICLTLGPRGLYVGFEDQINRLAPRRIQVKDTTGAGDAFWSGYLTAWLDGYSPEDCAIAGRKMAEMKLGHFGHLPDRINRQALYGDLPHRLA